MASASKWSECWPPRCRKGMTISTAWFTFLGGVLGVVLAYIVALSVGRLTLYSAFAKNGEAGDIRLIIQPATLIASTVILGAVGLISGMIPAFRASRLDPIESLRHE